MCTFIHVRATTSQYQGRSRFYAALWLAVMVLLLSALPASAKAQGTFNTLVGLTMTDGRPSTHSVVTGVSADGSAIVGYSRSRNGREAFLWTQAEGMIGLGDLPGGRFSGRATGVSADGSVVVGYSHGRNGTEAFRWTRATGMVGLGDLPGGSFSSMATGVSADGSVVVGQGVGADRQREAFIWTRTTGMVGLGDLPGGAFLSMATGVSADGSVVVGRGVGAVGLNEAFIWTRATGMVGLGDLPGGAFSSLATGVSADGSVVVGSGTEGPEDMRSPGQSRAFRWTQATGMVGLDLFLDRRGNPRQGSYATGVSADGSVVVGEMPETTVFWVQGQGIQTLATWLDTKGVTVAPDRASRISRRLNQGPIFVSSNGSVVVGTIRSSFGNEVFRASVDGPPQ